MSDEANKILTTIPGKNSLKFPFIICADIECLLQKTSTCSNNHEKSYTEKKAVHKASGCSLIICCRFDKSENEREYYRGRDCMKMFCNDLKEQAIRIINYEQKPMIPLTNIEKDRMRISKFVIYVKGNFVLITIMKKNLKNAKS